MLASYPSKAKQIKAITAQIQFRRDVLNQKPSQRSLFSKTKKDSATTKRTNLSVPEMASNLKELVKDAVVEDKHSREARYLLVGKRVKHRFISQDTSGHDIITWFFGKIISQVKWKLRLNLINRLAPGRTLSAGKNTSYFPSRPRSAGSRQLEVGSLKYFS